MQKDPEIDKKVPRNRTHSIQTSPKVNISIDLVISVYFYPQVKIRYLVYRVINSSIQDTMGCEASSNLVAVHPAEPHEVSLV